jgi:hypothetical protein
MVVACSNPPQTASHPSASSAASASQSPSPAATPTRFDLQLSTVNFSCRLPIWTPTNKGAFVSFPTGTVSVDPNPPATVGSAWGLYYDRAFSRWLPVPRQAVSPDGKHYAYGKPGVDQTKVATMHVVDVATGKDHVFATPSTDWFVPYGVLDYTSDGVYLITNYEVSHGLALMNPVTGVIKPVADLFNIQASGGNKTFWVGSVNSADAHPVGGIGIQPNQIDRFSLDDRKRVAWFYRPSTAPLVIGSDAQGHPFVWAVNGRNGVVDGDYGAELILLSSPQSRQSIFNGSAQLFGSSIATISDSHGTWFGTDRGIYLYTGTYLMKVSNQPGYPANGCF